jgi:hypothetical protein
MTSKLLLVAGIPGTGKTTFCQCLQGNEGWIHLDIDWLTPRPLPQRGCATGTSKPWPNEQLRQSWDQAISTNNPAIFAEACKRVGNVVLDWGFPVRCISFVQGLASYGVKVLWFDGDVEEAKRVFTERGTVCLDAFEQQVSSLISTNVPHAIGAKVLRVLEKGPQFMPYGQIYKEMLSLFGE